MLITDGFGSYYWLDVTRMVMVLNFYDLNSIQGQGKNWPFRVNLKGQCPAPRIK